MKLRLIMPLFLAALLGACASGSTVAEKRATIQKMRADTLAKLYKLQPGCLGEFFPELAASAKKIY